MKKKTKALLLASGAVVLVAGSVLGTLAYLTDKDEVINTFTMGQVDISLAESDVDGDGDVLNNTYRIVPGASYVKDPTISIAAGSDDAYIRMVVTVHNWSAAEELMFKSAPYADVLGGYDSAVWVYEGTTEKAGNTAEIEYRYYKAENTLDSSKDLPLTALFTTLDVPGTLNGADLQALSEGGFKMVVEGHAIQATGFASQDEAWAAFDEQMNAVSE